MLVGTSSVKARESSVEVTEPRPLLWVARPERFIGRGIGCKLKRMDEALSTRGKMMSRYGRQFASAASEMFLMNSEAPTRTQPPEGEEFGPRGLLVRDPYASQLLNGEKIWEIRGKPTQIRGPVVIIKSGTGRAYGTAKLVRVLGPLELDDLTLASELPRDERELFRREGLPYSKTYAYVFTDPRWFESPIPYRHPSGAVTWVRLPELNLEAVSYAPPRYRAAQLNLV
jgi:hypothetical protein